MPHFLVVTMERNPTSPWTFSTNHFKNNKETKDIPIIIVYGIKKKLLADFPL